MREDFLHQGFQNLSSDRETYITHTKRQTRPKLYITSLHGCSKTSIIKIQSSLTESNLSATTSPALSAAPPGLTLDIKMPCKQTTDKLQQRFLRDF